MQGLNIDSILAALGLPSLAELNPVMLAVAGATVAVAVTIGWLAQKLATPAIERAVASGKIPVEEDRAPQITRIVVRKDLIND